MNLYLAISSLEEEGEADRHLCADTAPGNTCYFPLFLKIVIACKSIVGAVALVVLMES